MEIIYRGEPYEVLKTVNIGKENEPHFILKAYDGRIYRLSMIREYTDGLTEITHWKKIV